MRGDWRRKIDWAMVSLIFAVTFAILSGWAAYHTFNGGVSERLDAIDGRLDELREDLRELRRR